MKRTIFFAIICLMPVTMAFAQRGGQEWATSNADAQRSSWIRTDPKTSRASMQKPGFQFLWKVKLDNEAKQLNSLAQPVMMDRLIGYRGFKSLAFIGGSSDALYAIDYDFGSLYWKTGFKNASASRPGSSLACPGGLTAAATRAVNLLPPAQGRGGGGGGNRISSARARVGEPDQGFPDIFDRPVAAPADGGRGGRGGGGGGGGGGRGGGADGFNPGGSVFVLSSDGMLHQLSVQTGKDIGMTPKQFVPANANASALILADGVLYTSTSNDCGGAANGVWAMDVASPDKPVTSWKASGPGIASFTGPTLGTDGTVYVAAGDSVFALEPRTLKQRDSFTQQKANFTAAPLVFQHNGKDLVAAAGKDGRLYILNSTSLGGANHQTPLSSMPVATNLAADFAPAALASWQDESGTRWILAPTNASIAAFKVVEQNGVPMLQQGWVSREMTAPLPPIIINGVVFALSSGEYRSGASAMTAAQRAQRSKPAVLYALDASTGKEFWNSGNAITSFANGGGLSGGFGEVFVTTYDSTFYAFGFPIEK